MAAKPCSKCKGCGKLASHNSQPWSQFSGFAYNSEQMDLVRNGETNPIICQECNGAGFEAEKKPATSSK